MQSDSFVDLARTAVIVTAVIILGAAVVGCRDVTLHGARIADSHVLASRPASRGGPLATDEELRRGWFETVDGDLSSTQTALRSMLGLEVHVEFNQEGLPGTLSLFASDTVVAPAPDFRRPPVTLPPQTLTSPYATLSTNGLLSDLTAACADPLLQPIVGNAVCNSLNFDTDNLAWDALTFRSDSAGVGVEWLAPQALFNVNNKVVSPADEQGDTCDTTDNLCGFGFTCVSNRCRWDVVACTSDLDCVTDTTFGALAGSCQLSPSRRVRACAQRMLVRFDSDTSLDQPVLGISIPWSGESDPQTDFSVGVATVSFRSFTSRLRVQPTISTDAAATNSYRSYAGYRGPSPSGDIRNDGIGVELHVEGELITVDYGVDPGIGLVLACTNPIGCFAAHYSIDATIRRTLRDQAQDQARILEGILSERQIPLTVGNNVSDAVQFGLWDLNVERTGVPLTPVAPGQTWAQAVAILTAQSLPLSQFEYGVDDLSNALAPDGAHDGALVQALASGAPMTVATWDARALVTLCGSNPRVATGGTCGAIPTAPNCGICAVCLGSTSSLCDWGTLLGVGSCTEAGTGCAPGDLCLARTCLRPTMTLGPANVIGSTGNRHVFVPVPAMPSAAPVLDATYGIAEQVRGLFAGPLARRAPTFRRYSDVAYCAPTDRGARCPTDARTDPTAERVVFHFQADADVDGLPDGFDLCPVDATGTELDFDGDGHGDACDLCPFHPGPNGDADRDGLGDMCDCDLDDDGCNQTLLVTPVTPSPPPPGLVTFCPVSGVGRTYDQAPRESDLGRDNEPDGIPDDCDPDDDNDGVLDDGAGDGLGTYTPCPRSTTRCDDNCQLAANPGQADENVDGHGDACDPICRGAGLAICEPGAAAMFGGGADEEGDGAAMFSDCRADGPDCDFLVGLCASYGARSAYSWPGIRGCDIGPALVNVVGPAGKLVDRLDISALGGSRFGTAAFIPDVDGDGIEEFVIGMPGSRSANAAIGELPPAVGGTIAAIGSLTGATLWSWSADGITLPFSAAFGSAIASDGERIYVGASDAFEAGAVLVLEPGQGLLVDQILAPDVRPHPRALRGQPPIAGPPEHTREPDAFGASLAVGIDGTLYVGAPFTRRGAGRIYVLEQGVATSALDVAFAGTHVGSGPIVPFVASLPYDRRGTRVGFIAGSPEAANGAGLIIVANPDGDVVTWHFGHQGERLGHAISPLVDVRGDGIEQALVGAPGFANRQGRVYVLTNGFRLLETDMIGAVGEEIGISVGAWTRDDGAIFRVASAGRLFPAAPLPGVWTTFAGGP